MDEDLLSSLTVLVTVVLTPLLSMAGKYLVTLLKVKAENEISVKHINKAMKIVKSSVNTIMQTYVDQLKKSNSFSLEEQKKALEKAIVLVNMQLNKDTREYIIKNYSDLNLWITTQIEGYINNLKKKKISH